MTATTLNGDAFAFDAATGLGRSTPAGPGLALSLHGLAKAFGQKTVLQGVDLDIPSGQFVAVIGRSGCGKSTLLRLIAGLERPTAGELSFDGSRSAGGQVRMMFQEPRLLPWARIGANVAVGLDRRGGIAARADQAINALREVGLADRAGEWPAVLSGGQKQRVALARALVSRPRL